MTKYKDIITPAWMFGIQLWESDSYSNIMKIQLFQHKVINATVDATWLVPYYVLRRDPLFQ